MATRVRITDVAPRDGLQNEPDPVETDDKVRLIELLARTGVDEIEATSFVSPKWIPQLGDAAEVIEALRGDVFFSGGPALSVLVPNEKGYRRALDAFEGVGTPKIGVFTAASETFSQRNANASIDETIDRFAAFLPDAFERGLSVRLYVSCAVECPFEGPMEPRGVRVLVDRLLSLAPHEAVNEGRVEVDLGDTIGAATPASIDHLLDAFDDSPMMAHLVLHLHDTHGRASDCVRRALERGVRSFDASAAGLGGCPYAGTKRKPAPGNIATRTLVETVHDAGFETGVDMKALEEASAFAQSLTGPRSSAA